MLKSKGARRVVMLMMEDFQNMEILEDVPEQGMSVNEFLYELCSSLMKLSDCGQCVVHSKNVAEWLRKRGAIVEYKDGYYNIVVKGG